MKKLVSLLFCLSSLAIFGQAPKAGFDGNKWNAPYTLDFPKGWDVERFLIPIEFAPSIPYKGVEDIRFMPGWGNTKSEAYWSYAFLWYLEGKTELTEKIVADNLRAYYTGLIERNIEPRKIPAEKVFPVKTTIEAVKTDTGDFKTFRGTIHMLDYMEQKPVTLNCIIHLKFCEGKSHTFIFNEISPKPFSDPVWISLNNLWTGFNCHKVSRN